ncbi:MAG: hypothetical protein PVI15_11285, partial [Chromatiales bacterium]
MRTRLSWHWPLLGLAFLLFQAPQVFAISSFLDQFNSTYSASASGTNANCQLCHTSRFSEFNEYGFQYLRSGLNFSAIEGLASANIN